MNELFIKARKITRKKYKTTNEFYNYILFTCFSLLTKYEYCKDIIEYLIQNTDVIIENKTLPDIINEHEEFGLSNIIENNETILTLAVSFNGITLQNEKLNIEPAKIIVSSILGTSDVISNLVHEFSHLIKAFFNSYSYNPTGYLKIRNGLNIYESWPDGSEKKTNLIFDEVINSLQTKDMTQNIKNLNSSIFTKEEKNFFENLDLNYLSEIQGYEDISHLFENIWQYEDFKNVFENDLIIGNISNIENNFNNLIGINLFKKLSKALDLFYYHEDKISAQLIKNTIILLEITLKEKNLSKETLKKCKNVVK